ncbi:glycosyltransferase family 2 protein [Methylocaldum sp. RMAD-M]|jgi:glycosyltransferase involved in cell wall biosynthesis|uniref:glycosyltransferase family 2 protein n=1 Tax=Methylocaldum sp. RMAD-M TaxID=2806557 RepID=UPI000A31ECEA|nr:glycosyltransferase family 2 protein [Methylocaldum sp. RMAD-M]MBP1148774.1 glycosyltransferase involved in cell wall biosynthesis [Methylocaldum sp. RMAD-M]
MPSYSFTVFTPTYNRARLLAEVFESLKAQTFTDFEWIIVDDGSTDDTRARVEEWQASAGFPIVYVHQENRGKHVAINQGLMLASGEFFLIQDSDDLLLPHTLKRFHEIWNAIPPEEKESLDGVMGLCAYRDGSIVPKRFPRDSMDMSHREYWFEMNMKGDKCYFVRTERLRSYPFPEIPGEKFLAEGVVFNRLNPRFRCVNEVMRIIQYLPDGLTAKARAIRYRSPRGARLYYGEAVRLPTGIKPKLKNMANFIRYSVHAGESLYASLAEVGFPLLFGISLPIGLGLAWIDKARLASSR